MKKIIIVFLVLFTLSLEKNLVKAGDYLAYQDISFVSHGNKFISQFNEDDYKKYYKKLGKRRFFGWRTFTVFDGIKVIYDKETMYILENTGTTPIQQIYSMKTEESVKKQYSVSGNIGLSVKGDAGGFKLGLEDNIKGSITANTLKKEDERFEVKLDVDPNTRVVVMIKGEGKITNGVAKYYRFFKNVKKGGFEVFVVTTEYFSLVKEPIDE
ncbi:hypothetical protein CI105_09055 [Candidatus Izimaplasma bacterium ZiA1]|uniref:hypothetical protein n=1 Tax=Candidatus Izimoplasma sp. ZiA1 TaxID=2024899 RepID=UPI000BAA63DB|nr:hypothetical protein CI105_09055 [Candidatus Izimaplasma bacterium ZiA1]